MEERTTNWSKDEFIAFIMAYAAQADMEITDSEMDIICQQVGQECYDKILPTLKEQSDYQNLQLILELREKYYPGEEGKKELLAKVRSIFKTDGEVSQMERIYDKGLRRLL